MINHHKALYITLGQFSLSLSKSWWWAVVTFLRFLLWIAGSPFFTSRLRSFCICCWKNSPGKKLQKVLGPLTLKTERCWKITIFWAHLMVQLEAPSIQEHESYKWYKIQYWSWVGFFSWRSFSTSFEKKYEWFTECLLLGAPKEFRR